MSHRRVIPRDLFCEGNLLTWLGRLALLEVDDMLPSGVCCVLDHDTPGFEVVQDPSSGMLTVENFRLHVAGVAHRVWRPYGRREPYTLYLCLEADDLLILDRSGDPTPEFLAYCRNYGEKKKD